MVAVVVLELEKRAEGESMEAMDGWIGLKDVVVCWLVGLCFELS